MNLEEIIPSEISHREKDNCVWPHLYVDLKHPKLQKESRFVVARGGQVREVREGVQRVQTSTFF